MKVTTFFKHALAVVLLVIAATGPFDAGYVYACGAIGLVLAYSSFDD